MKPKKRATKTEEPSFEKIDWRSYGEVVIGVDEVGRGCLAGPVAAAACLFATGDLEHELTDSKKLTEKRREELSEKILAVHRAHWALSSVEEIDEINILQASFLAMRRAIQQLEDGLLGTPFEKWIGKAPIVVDGHMKIPKLSKKRQIALVKGDLRCAPVSAASIVAKVARDQLMKAHGEKFPGYGFEVHKGYSTALHMDAIAKMGPMILHRRTFAGVREYL